MALQLLIVGIIYCLYDYSTQVRGEHYTLAWVYHVLILCVL